MIRVRDSLRNVYESYPTERDFGRHMVRLIEQGQFDQNEADIINQLPSAMGLKLESEISNFARFSADALFPEQEVREALSSSAFPKISSALINRVVQQAYQKSTGQAMGLVTVIPSSQKDDTIVGFGEDMTPQEVPEGMSYQEGSITEKNHKIRNRKWGRIISLTAEMIKFDQTGQMIARARRIGESTRAKQERLIWDAIIEFASTGLYASWRPNGTATTLYSNTSNDPFTGGTLDNQITDVLTDETDITPAFALFGGYTDENGDPMVINPDTILVPIALNSIASGIVGSNQNVKLTSPAGIKNIYSGMNVVATPYIDQLASATRWYIGEFKKQFVYTEVFPFQVEQAKAGNDQEFERDVINRFKAGFMGGAGAVTNRYVIESLGTG